MVTKNCLKDLYKNKINILIIVLYTIIVIITMFHHEIWRDEARVWAILLNLNIEEILNRIRFDGHPYLWYILLFPFAKLNFSLFSIQIISVLVGILSVIFFIFKSPFDSIIKSLFVFSAGMLYFLPIIARSYILIPLLIFILAYLYHKRLSYPYKYIIILILISQTHCQMWGFFLICSLIFLFEILTKAYREKNYKLIFIPFLLILYTTFMVIIYKPVFLDNDFVSDLSNIFVYFTFDNLFFFKSFFQELIGYGINKFVFISLISCLCMLCIFFFKYNKKISIIFVTSSLYVLYIFLKVWAGGIIYQKIFFIILILIFCCWIILKEQEKISKFFKCLIYISFILLFFSPLSFFSIYDDIENKMTNIKEICNFIKRKQVVDNEILIITEICDDNFLANTNKIPHYTLTSIDDSKNFVEKVKLISNFKYIITEYDIEDFVINNNYEIKYEIKNKYKKVLSCPKNKVNYYNTGEYYDVWERQE